MRKGQNDLVKRECAQCSNFTPNQLEKLEAARSAYLWLPLVTFGYLWLTLVTFGYLWLPFLALLSLSRPY